MTIREAAEAREPVRPVEAGESTDIGAKVIQLAPKPNGKPKTPFYVVGKGVFDSSEHYAKICGAPEMPDHAAIGYTPEVLAYLREPKDYSDRHLWP